MRPLGDLAVVGGRVCTGRVELSSDLGALDRRAPGRWAVVLAFDGPPVLARFAQVGPPGVVDGGPWSGPPPSSWTSSLGPDAYTWGSTPEGDFAETGLEAARLLAVASGQGVAP
ncbi:MAG: hypothetical protein ABR511_10240 [Acidimicrobiales bacterium]